MKVLIYEPGTGGHRPVYLRYIIEGFVESGCEVVVVTESYVSSPRALAQIAIRQRVDAVFVCTLDGIFNWLFSLALYCRIHGIRVAGIYYLFNNLYGGWKGYFWRFLLRTKLLTRVFVPDLLLNRRTLHGLAGQITFIVDPWDKRCLAPVRRDEAMLACGITNLSACVFLIFGEISERKGLHLILFILEQWDYNSRPDIKILVAGRISEAVRSLIDQAIARRREIESAFIFEPRWIQEGEHGKYFSAAAYISALYPKEFTVSISTVFRAFAMRRPVIVGDHGMVGDIVCQRTAGFVCDTGSKEGALAVFEHAYDIYTALDKKTYDAMSRAGAMLAQTYELKYFKLTLKNWVAAEML